MQLEYSFFKRDRKISKNIESNVNMINNIPKIVTIVLPTIIIASPVSSLNCGNSSIQINSINNEPANIPYDDGFKSLVPDSYACHDGCNTCNFKINKFETYYQISGSSCTAKACYYPAGQREQKKIDYKLCSEHWMFSNWLSYNDVSLSLRRCINGYRNITFVKKQQTLDLNFSLEDSKTQKYTYLALSEGITACKKLFKFLEKENKFNKDQILYLGIYLGHRNFPNSDPESPYKILLGGDILEIQKEVFDYLSKNYPEISDIVTDEMLEEFHQRYEEYLTRKRAERLQKIYDFWHNFLNFFKF